jgi:glutamine synthetase
VLQLDHEDAHGQYEVNFAFDEALASCDHLMLFKLAAHALAEQARHGVLDDAQTLCQPAGQRAALPCLAVGHRSGHCDFAPRWADGELLSTLGQQFLAGVLAHSAACVRHWPPPLSTATSAWWSAKVAVWYQLGAGLTSPTEPNNRTALLRTLPGRFEWRLPDASANPYLATAAMIAAGTWMASSASSTPDQTAPRICSPSR